MDGAGPAAARPVVRAQYLRRTRTQHHVQAARDTAGTAHRTGPPLALRICVRGTPPVYDLCARVSAKEKFNTLCIVSLHSHTAAEGRMTVAYLSQRQKGEGVGGRK